MNVRRAAVDVGTNSCRLLVVDEHGGPLVRHGEITRLGKGVDAHGQLDDEALARTLDVIARYRDRWVQLGVDADAVRVAATSAVRDAEDRDRFFDGVRDLTGVAAEVLSGDEEATTTFRGVAARVDLPPPLVVLDVGGGSTELIVGGLDGEVVATVSMQVGSVRLTERFLTDDPPTRSQIARAREEVSQRLAEGRAQLVDRGADPTVGSLVGVAGTVTTLAALHLALDEHDPDVVHGTALLRTVVDALAGVLLGTPVAERSRLGAIASGREDVIAAGALIVQEVLRELAFRELVTSEADILDGLVLD